jgi:hypothetical protein
VLNDKKTLLGRALAVTAFALAGCGGATSQKGEGREPKQTAESLRFSKLVAGRERYCGLRQSDAALVCVQGGEISLERSGPFSEVALNEDITTYNELCTIDSAGQVACDFAKDVPVGELHGLALGFFNSCALDREGRVVCWVPDAIGGTSAPEIVGALELSVDMEHGCVRLDMFGHARCFGAPYDASISDLHFQQVSAAALRACGILLDPSLGAGIACVDESGVTLELTGDFTSLDTGFGGEGCAIDSDGMIRCWGDAKAPIHSRRLHQVSVSSHQICALDDDGAAHCFPAQG